MVLVWWAGLEVVLVWWGLVGRAGGGAGWVGRASLVWAGLEVVLVWGWRWC